MTCCRAPNTYEVPAGGSPCPCPYPFPPKTAWIRADYSFDLSAWLQPSCGGSSDITTETGFPITIETGAPLTASSGPDTIFVANVSVSPPDVTIRRVIIGAALITVELEDGVPYTNHLVACRVRTAQGAEAVFTGQLYVLGGPPGTSPYLADQYGYPITTENGDLLYWDGMSPSSWSYPVGSRIVIYDNGVPVSEGNGDLVVQ